MLIQNLKDDFVELESDEDSGESTTRLGGNVVNQSGLNIEDI